MRFQFYVKVYHHKLFTSSNLLFQLEDRVSRKTLHSCQGTSWITEIKWYRIQDTEKTNITI